jgi:hypothetical protein
MHDEIEDENDVTGGAKSMQGVHRLRKKNGIGLQGDNEPGWVLYWVCSGSNQWVGPSI